MKTKLRISLIFCAAISFYKVSGQDLDFTQWQANLPSFNPAYTGIGIDPKLNFATRQVLSRFTGPDQTSDFANTSMLNYDQQISPKAGFIGINYINQYVPGITLRDESINIFYAREYKLMENLHLRAGISIGAIQHSIQGSRMWYYDLTDLKTGVVFKHFRGFPEGRIYTRWAPNFSGGISGSFKNIYGSFAINNFLAPIFSFAGNPTTRFPRRYSANIGAFLPLKKDNPKSIIFAPYILLQDQGSFTEVVPGINANKGIFTGGLSYRHTNKNLSSINILIGVSKGKIKAAYSYDYAPQRIFGGPTHELSLSFYPGKLLENPAKNLAYYFRKMGF